MSSEQRAVMCRACGRRDGTHETDCRAVERAAKEKLQAECDHRPEYGEVQKLGGGCRRCGRCGRWRDEQDDSDTCCGDVDGGGGNAPPHESRVCQCYAPTCTNYLCAVCGTAVPWHRDLMIANPTISGRFCASCVDIEAAYHNLSVEEMHACRASLRVKRITRASRDPAPPTAGLSTNTTPLSPPQDARHRFAQEIACARAARTSFSPERLPPECVLPASVLPASALPERVLLVEKSKLPLRPYLERGEACWCHRAKDCNGNHEFHNVTVQFSK